MTSTEWLKESKKIGVNVRSLERSSALNELESDFREITRARDDAFLGTKKKVQYFKSSLQDIKDRLAEVTKFRSHSGALQKSLETFESKLTTYKSTMRADFDSLANEETALDKDLDAFAGRVDSWLKNEKNVLSAADTSSDNIPSEQKSRTSDRYDRHVQLQAKIGAIDRQIANLGGRYGSWDSQDHDAFIRCWVQTVPSTSEGNNATTITSAQRASLLRKLVKSVPIKTEEEFGAHMDWFMEYTDLLQTKKVWLDEWKHTRSTQKKRTEAEIIREATDTNEEGGGNGNKAEGAQTTAFTFVDREAVKERISRWKQEKVEVRAAKEQKEREQQFAEKERRDMERRKRQEDLRDRMDEWKKNEESVTQKLEATEQAMKRGKRVTSADLQSRQARDRQITQTTLARKEAAQDRLKAREVRIKQLEQDLPNDLNVKSDPTRVLASTKAQTFRKLSEETIVEAESRRANASAHNAPMAMSGRDLATARRAVPSWSKHAMS